MAPWDLVVITSLVFSGMVKVEVVEGTDLEPTPRMKRIPAFVPSRLNPYVMIDVTERTDGNRVVSRHIDKTVSVRGESEKGFNLILQWKK